MQMQEVSVKFAPPPPSKIKLGGDGQPVFQSSLTLRSAFAPFET